MNPLAENLWELERPLKAPGLRIGHRMTVVRLRDGGLWVHSPVECDDAVRGELARLGPVRHLIAPSRFHDLYWKEWFEHYPEATFYCAPGLKEEHPELRFHKVLSPDQRETWEDELPKVFVQGMPRLNEFVFLHRASRTLIVADLVFNLDAAQQNMLGKLFLKLNGIYDRAGCSRIFRSLIKDRAAFRASGEQILQLDFERLIPGHGRIVTAGARDVLRRALAAVR